MSIRYTYRVGSSLGRTIYQKVGGSPDERDKFLGIMDSPVFAARVVRLLNLEEALRDEPLGMARGDL